MKKSLLAFLIAAALAGGAQATYKMGTAAPVKVKKKSTVKHAPFPEASKPNPEIDVLKNLSEKFSVPAEQLSYYRKLRYGYEELVPSLVVAREAQVEIGRVLKMRDEKKTWQQITDYFSVNPSVVSDEAESSLKSIREALPKQALTEKPSVRGG
jgi:hypothetical protein